MRRRTTLLTSLWSAIVLAAVGVIWDVRWHAVHGSAAEAVELVEGHGILWVGVAATIGVAWFGRRVVVSRWCAGYRLLLIVSLVYALTEAGHVAAHLAALDAGVLHGLLVAGKVAIVAAAVSATVLTRRLASRDDSAQADPAARHGTSSKR